MKTYECKETGGTFTKCAYCKLGIHHLYATPMDIYDDSDNFIKTVYGHEECMRQSTSEDLERYINDDSI